MAITPDTTGVGSGSAVAVGTFAFTLPATVVAGDVLIATVNTRGSVTTTLSIAGWTLVINTANGTASGDARVATFIRVADGSTDSSNRTVTLSPTSVLDVAVMRYQGVDSVTPQDAAAVGQANVSSTSCVAPTITTVTDGAVVVMAQGNTGGVTSTPPGTMTERVEATTGGRDAVLNDEARPAAGATGTRTATLSGARLNVGQLIALRPAAAVRLRGVSQAVNRSATY